MYHAGYGTSKAMDKHGPGIKDKIYSTRTFNQYNKDFNRFCVWMGQSHPKVTTLTDAQKHIQSYVDNLVTAGKSPWTVRAYAAAENKVWPNKMPCEMDIHNCRAGYAARIYHENARPLETLCKAEIYYCRGEMAGTAYDRAALSAASTALGHGHYARDGTWHDNPGEIAEHYAYRF